MNTEIYTAREARLIIAAAISKLQLQCLDGIDRVFDRGGTVVLKKPTPWWRRIFGAPAEETVNESVAGDQLWKVALGHDLGYPSSTKEDLESAVNQYVKYTRECVSTLQELLERIKHHDPDDIVEIQHNLIKKLNEL